MESGNVRGFFIRHYSYYFLYLLLNSFVIALIIIIFHNSDRYTHVNYYIISYPYV